MHYRFLISFKIGGVFVIDRRAKNNNTQKKVFHPGKSLSSTLGTLIILLVALVTGIAAGFLLFYLSMYLQAKKASVVLPNYINSDSMKAEQDLREKGFRVVVIGEHGRVIKMDPSPSVSVKIGREVKLFTENVKIARLVLPDFKYCWYKSVEQVMRELGINTSVKTVPNPGMYGMVVSTSPNPGSEIMSYQSIVLFISSGKGSVENLQDSQQNIGNTLEPTGTDENLGGAVEIVPPDVNLNTSTNQTIQLKNQPQSVPQTSSQETNTVESDQTVEGGQF